ncbi:AAA family ATPase [Zavarzinella formosa]|uniref:AAA family ATPase n=1 Tax=Zavarzinella formosa TaxID=360055 RepID=UPI000377831A|nr:AAA family ATPase [Zavarzinella formosa]
MSGLASTCQRLWRWLTFPGPFPRGELSGASSPQVYTTGPELINHIVEAIELNQSVVLSGPRGCGKSYCIRAAIQAAMRRGILPDGAMVALQGNREIPRDYLLEDEIAFRLKKNRDQTQVLPYRRPAPLFAFAKRDDTTGDPVCGDGQRVVLKNNWNRFVLFLDEINRFSDGVLDGLLSVLEERKAVLAGLEYSLPVVVCMTMNPPGYDGSARRLSPPLAARIGRTYRLCTPDLDTLTDQILTKKVNDLQSAYNSEKSAWDAIHSDKPRPDFPLVPAKLLRKVGLTTLCLWGEISPTRMGNEYLTPETRNLLAHISQRDRTLGGAMRELSGLCQFGPDGRAGADWLTAAIGLALGDAERNQQRQAVINVEHLTRTAVISLAHKIYDNFSPASSPDKTDAKERAVSLIAGQVLTRPWLDRLVDRQVDDDAALRGHFSKFSKGMLAKGNDLSRLFREAGIVDDIEIARWDQVMHRFMERLKPGSDHTARDLLPILIDVGLVEAAEVELAGRAPALKAGFNDSRHHALARRLAERGGFLGTALSGLLEGPAAALGAVRPSLGSDLESSYLIRHLGMERFEQVCVSANLTRRRDRLAVCRMLETLWAFPYERSPALEAVDQLEQDVVHAGSRTQLLGALKKFLPHELLRAVSAVREPEVVAYFRFLKLVVRELSRRAL